MRAPCHGVGPGSTQGSCPSRHLDELAEIRQQLHSAVMRDCKRGALERVFDVSSAALNGDVDAWLGRRAEAAPQRISGRAAKKVEH